MRAICSFGSLITPIGCRYFEIFQGGTSHEQWEWNRAILSRSLRSFSGFQGAGRQYIKHWAVEDGRYVAIVRSNFDSRPGNDAAGPKVCLSGVCATVHLAEEAAANDAIQFMTRQANGGGFAASMHLDGLATTMSLQATLPSVYQVTEESDAEAKE